MNYNQQLRSKKWKEKRQSNSWRAYVTIKGKFKNLGYWKTELEASKKVTEYLKSIKLQ